MIVCYNSHHNSELFRYECECLSNMLLQELEKYIIKPQRNKPFGSITEKKGIICFNVSEEEYSRVDVRKIMNILPIKFMSEMSELNVDVPIFLAKKIVQLLKIVQSPNPHQLDVFNQYLLWNIMNNADSNDKSRYNHIRKLINMEVKNYLIEIGDVKNQEEKIFAQEMYSKIFKNLKSVFDAENNGEISIFREHFDLEYFFKYTLEETIVMLYKTNPIYNSQYFEKIFTDVSTEMPFQIIDSIFNNGIHNVQVYVSDENRKSNKKHGEIISFPLQSFCNG